MRNNKGFVFDIKSLTEEGTFEGFLSVYGVVDLGKEMVAAGAFSKTIQERGTQVPLLWQHDTKQPIGLLDLEEREGGLWVKGTLVLEVERAREAYALMKAGVVKGLSIGYDIIRSTIEGGVKVLKELKLYEGSAVTFPMCEAAQIATVKAQTKDSEFNSVLESIQLWGMPSNMLYALSSSLDGVLYANGLTDDQRVTNAADTIDQFKSTYVDFLPKWFALMSGTKGLAEMLENKAGRRLSQATVDQINAVMTELQKLLAGSADAESVTDPEVVEEKSQTPEANHLWLTELKNEISGVLYAK